MEELIEACRFGHKQAVSILIENGVNIEARDKDGRAPLHIACENGHNELVSLLLERGANIEALDDKERRTPLFFACLKGQNELVSLLLDKRVSIEAKDKEGRTPLHFSCWNGYKEVVSLLLERGANIEALDKELEKTPLFFACWKGHKEVVSLLLEKGANIQAVDQEGRTPLQLACFTGHKEVVSILLEKGANIEAKDKLGRSPLFFACENGYKEVVSLLLERGANIEDKDKDGNTPLHFSGSKDQKEVVSFLIEKGANIEVEDADGNTILFFACWKGYEEVVSLLLERGANIEDKDKTPLHISCKYGYKEVVSLLLDRGALLEAKDKNEKAALHFACENGRKEVVSILLEKGANIEAKDKLGRTALHFASENGYKEVVSLLLEKGATIEANDKDGNTPIHLACRIGHEEVVSFLLDSGANLESKDNNGQTPLHASSCVQRNEEVVSFLLERGANIEAKDNDGNTPIHLACRIGHKEVVSFLLDSGANLESKDNNGQTPLHASSCVQRNEEVVSLLLEKGANIEAKDNNGDTPILLAHRMNLLGIMIILLRFGARFEPAQSDSFPSFLRKRIPPREYGLKIACEEKLDPEIVSLLLSQGADPSEPLKNRFALSHQIIELLNDKVSPFFLACELWGGEVFDIHVSRGADPRSTNKDGHSPLLISILKNNDILLSHLINKYHLDLPSEAEHKNLLLFTREQKLLRSRSCIWSHIVQDVKYIELVRQSLLADPSLYSLLDRHQRLISSLALPAVLKVMDEVLLMFGRYRLLEDRPEHQSATCFVFKAEDQRLRDESGAKMKVALKLMLRKDQFKREVEMRSNYNFEETHVISVLTQHPSEPSEISSRPELIPLDPSQVVNGVPTKSLAESMFAISLPLADRNLFVALKQERFAGKDWNMVKFIFKDLVESVDHIHSKGIIHADLKPLNIVRVDGDWRLIDLDACCRIGVDHTGLKSSSAFCPPESIYVDRSVSPPIASVRSQEHMDQTGLSYDLLLADPSFDVWSLGCIFYQMCTDCRMLFQGGQDDNLRADNGSDSLFHLAEWSDTLKTQKLSVVEDPLARNLLSQMLMKDPSKRLSLARILEHPFVTGRQVSRLVGEAAEFDVFLSYRVWSDAVHVEYLYNELIAEDLKVWWDKKELKKGENWEEGFCNGLVKSRIFVPFFSRKGLANFSTLSDSSPCDNVLLEHRLALELKGMGLIEGIFPIIMGEEVAASQRRIDWSTIYPSVSDVSVSSVEMNTTHHLHNQALGSPLTPNRTVLSVLSEMRKMQGALIEGEYDTKMNEAARMIVEMIRPPPSHQKTESLTPLAPIGGELSSESQHVINILTREIEKFPQGERRMEIISQLSEQLPDILRHISLL